CCAPFLIHNRHRELRACVAVIWPAAGDGLRLRVEAEGIWPVLVKVTETRGFPTTKGVVSNRHRNWNIDADHSDIDLGCEVTGGSAIRGENSNTIAILVFSWELFCLFHSIIAYTRYYLTIYLIYISFHLLLN